MSLKIQRHCHWATSWQLSVNIWRHCHWMYSTIPIVIECIAQYFMKYLYSTVRCHEIYSTMYSTIVMKYFAPLSLNYMHPPSSSKFTPFCCGGFSSYEDILYFTTRCGLFREQIWVIIEFRSSQLRPSQMGNQYTDEWNQYTLCSLRRVPVWPPRKDAKKLITCVIVVWKNVLPFDFLPVHILQVSFGHCRPLAASQVNRRKDMEVLHKFAQP